MGSLAFMAVALTAGIYEEIRYRGWLVSFLGAGLGSIWLGVVVAGIIFGAAHAYQGRRGMIAAGILGQIFGVMFVWVRSLLPGQALHTAIDLLNGILAGRTVSRTRFEPKKEG